MCKILHSNATTLMLQHVGFVLNIINESNEFLMFTFFQHYIGYYKLLLCFFGAIQHFVLRNVQFFLYLNLYLVWYSIFHSLHRFYRLSKYSFEANCRKNGIHFKTGKIGEASSYKRRI